MKKARRSFATGALLLFLFAAKAAFAQESNVRATFFGSGSFLKAERNFTVDGDAKRSNFADGGRIGARFTVDLDSHWAAEGGYGTNNLRILDVGAPTITRAFGTRIHQFTGNMSYYFSEPHHGLRPFVTAGAGIMRFNPTSKAKSAAAIQFVNIRPPSCDCFLPRCNPAARQRSVLAWKHLRGNITNGGIAIAGIPPQQAKTGLTGDPGLPKNGN